jgi:hypothetical protein
MRTELGASPAIYGYLELYITWSDVLPQIYDLFISYSSHDRPWAERFYADMHRAYPWLKIFLDRSEIMAAADWRKELRQAIFACRHLVLFWTPQAKESVEVLQEIGIFSVLMQQSPKLDQSKRLAFAFLLRDSPGGILATSQGFPAFEKFYDPDKEDRGAGALDTDRCLMTEWRRALRMIKEAASEADEGVKVPIAVVAMTKDRLSRLDANHDLVMVQGAPTLDRYLAAYGLDWPTVRTRYQPDGLSWRPYGGEETIVQLLDSLRVEVNRTDKTGLYQFQWDYVDLQSADLDEQLPKLKQGSIIVVDSISLFEDTAAAEYRMLEQDVLDESSVMISLAPVGPIKEDWLKDSLFPRRFSVLNDHFSPKIPPLARIVQCFLDIQRMSDLERLVRRRVGISYLKTKKDEARSITGMGSR